MTEALVLAGGYGTRLRAVISDVPKPMAPIKGRPFLEIVLTDLARKGFRRVVLSLGYLSEKVVSHFGPRFAGIDLVYEIEDEPLGTGGAVRAALMRCSSDHVYVLNGDTRLDFERAAIDSLWKKRHSPIIVAREVADTGRYGRLEVAHGRVIGFSEKGVSGVGLINAGCYVLPRRIFDGFPIRGAFSLENDFLVQAVAGAHFEVFVTHGDFIDIGVPEDYVRAQDELAGLLS